MLCVFSLTPRKSHHSLHSTLIPILFVDAYKEVKVQSGARVDTVGTVGKTCALHVADLG